MLLKKKPEDFVVEERARVEPQRKGPIALYELKKKKVDTFEAIRRVAAKAKLPLNKFNYAGLKDRQGVTTQFVSVKGRVDTKLRIPGIKLRYLGRVSEPLSASDLLGNAFTVVVRDLYPKEVAAFRERLPRLEAHGLINYFDDQRFGTVDTGEGMPGRAMVLGNFEEAIKLMVATPGLRDPESEVRFKHLVLKRWGDWDLLAKKWGNRRGAGMIRHLRHRPTDFKGALRKCAPNERAIHIFAYQSLLWNRSVSTYLDGRLGRGERFVTPYAAGRHLWPDLAADAELHLPKTWPLLDHTVTFEDDEIRAAVEGVLADEGLTVADFRIRGIRGCFFRTYERDLRVWPAELEVLSGPERDETRDGRQKVALRFVLPPGAYATLLLKRLFSVPRRDRPS